MAFDVYPVTVRGPLATVRSGVATFARMFEFEGDLYIAQSNNKGLTVDEVHRYELPEGSPSRPGRQARWGDWSYTSCGCSNHWNRHSLASLAGLADPEPEIQDELPESEE